MPLHPLLSVLSVSSVWLMAAFHMYNVHVYNVQLRYHYLMFNSPQSKRALKSILTHCVHLPALEPLLHTAPPHILKHVVGQFSKVLPHDPKARRLFVTSGGLKKVRMCAWCTLLSASPTKQIDTLYLAYVHIHNVCSSLAIYLPPLNVDEIHTCEQSGRT